MSIKKAPYKIDQLKPLGEEASEASVASLAQIVLADGRLLFLKLTMGKESKKAP